MTNQEEIYRAEEAKRLIEHPLFKDALDSVKSGVVGAMGNSGMGDTETHNRLVIALQLLNQIEKSIKTHIETGQLAEISVRESMAQRLKRVF